MPVWTDAPHNASASGQPHRYQRRLSQPLCDIARQIKKTLSALWIDCHFQRRTDRCKRHGDKHIMKQPVLLHERMKTAHHHKELDIACTQRPH